LKFAGILKDDIADSLDGIAVSFWCQGCPFHCKGCQNPQTWDEEGGYDLPNDYIEKVISLINEDGIVRNLSILGGEPFYKKNKNIILELIEQVRLASPETKIYIWTGYTLQELLNGDADEDEVLTEKILSKIDYLIDGRFEEKLKCKNMPLRGSSNQNLYKNTHSSNSLPESFEKIESLI
jgi:anaerobic ribonucleoside-triphosphate reductase activating protein